LSIKTNAPPRGGVPMTARDNVRCGATIARSRMTAGKTMRSAIHADRYN
jgi:hypothetical protein